MIPAVAIIITLSIVVFVHELGHLLAALKLGAKVEAFSIGFGPEIFGITFKGVRYKISVLPLGGYVKMKGENPDSKDAYESDSFWGLKPFSRIGVLASGSLMNFLTGAMIFSLLIYFTGLPKFTDKPIVGSVMVDMPAARAGIKEGDRIVSIDGVEVHTWQQMTGIVSKNKGEPLEIKIKRDNIFKTITLTPDVDKEIGRALIGITSKFEIIRMGIFGSFYEGFKYTLFLIWQIAISLWLIITGQIAAAVAGPVGIAHMVSQAAKAGVGSLFQIIAIISINLGFINLLPIPVLDGGSIVFALAEKIKGSPIDPKKINVCNIVGLALIATLLVIVTFNDIIRSFF